MYIDFDTGFGIIKTDELNIIKDCKVGDGFFIVNNNKRLFFQAGDSKPNVCIDPNNNIGIGKIQPEYKLDINGSILVNDYKLQKNSLTIIDSNSNINSNGNLDISKNLTVNNNKFTINPINGNTIITGFLDVNGIRVNNDKLYIDSSGNIFTNNYIDIQGNLNLLNKFNVSSSGDTKILNTLDVLNNTFFKKSAKIIGSLDVVNNNNHILYIDVSNNKIGINTSTIDPSFNFHIKGNTRIEGAILVNGITTIGNTIQLINTITSIENTYQSTSHQLAITNLGTGPALQINQIGSEPILNLKDDNNTVFYIKNGGLIGIGNNNINPTYNWDVFGSMNISNNLYLNTIMNVTGESIFNGNLQCGNKLYLTNNLYVNNNKFVTDTSGNINILGNVNIWGDLTTKGDINQSGLFNLSGDLIVNKNTYVKKNVDVSQNLRINNNAFTVNNIGNITLKGNLDISKNFTLNNNYFSVDSNTGNIYSKGFIDISQNLRVASNKVTFNSIGNITAQNNINLKGSFNINNKFIANNNVTSQGKLDISRNITINKNKFIIDLNGNLKTSGNVDISNSLIINNNKCIISPLGNIQSSGKLDISKNFYINTDKFIINSNGDVKSQGSLDISNNFRLNSDKFTIDISGNISSKGNLDISNNLNINNSAFKIDSNGNLTSKGTFDISNNFISGGVLYVDSINKKIGINNPNPIYTLDVSDTIATTNVYFGSLNNTNDDIIFSHRNNVNNISYALKQTQSGKTIINGKSITNSIDFHFNNIVIHKIDSSGNMIMNGNVFVYSDQNIKTNIENITDAINKILSIRGVSYNLIKDPFKRKHIGVIAQEIEQILPEIIENDGEYKTVCYSYLIGFLIEAIKDLSNKIDMKMRLYL